MGIDFVEDLVCGISTFNLGMLDLTLSGLNASSDVLEVFYFDLCDSLVGIISN